MTDTRTPMLITLKVRDGEIKATGVSEDVTLFKDAPFKGLNEAFLYFVRQYKSTHRVQVLVHPLCKEYP
jgi:hypothetical protein